MDYFYAVNDYLKGYGIPQEVIKETLLKMTIKKVTKGQILLQEGEMPKEICFIIKGLVRGFYLEEDGEEITKCFAREDDWCYVSSFIQGEPSKFWIEALEDCALAAIKQEDMKYLLTKEKAYQEMYNVLNMKVLSGYEIQEKNFRCQSATKRYLSFIQNEPELAKRVDQRYIASYLGITPSTLSRIKKKSIELITKKCYNNKVIMK